MFNSSYRIVLITLLVLVQGLVVPFHALAHDIESSCACAEVDGDNPRNEVDIQADARSCTTQELDEEATCLHSVETDSCHAYDHHDAQCHCSSDHGAYVARSIAVVNLAIINHGMSLDNQGNHHSDDIPLQQALCSGSTLQSILSLRGPPSI